jgi:nitrate/nitrite transporter NarK
MNDAIVASLPARAVTAPTRVRYGVLGFAAALSMITYLDRVCFGTVADHIKLEFGLSDAQKGYLFTAFALAYAAFEVPSGWLGDLFGPRKMLIRIVVWWSLFTALTGSIYPGAPGAFLPFAALLTVRFLFGLGEAGAYPTIARAFHNWFPFRERGFAQGTVWMAGRFAGGITPLVVLALLVKVEEGSETVVYWRHIFWIFGGVGLIWCVLFWFWFRDRPEQKATVNQAELDLIHGGQTPEAGHLHVPWLKILFDGNLWILCLMYFCAAYGWYFNITWLPGYLESTYGVTEKSWGFWTTSFLCGAPLLAGSLACLVGGLLTDLFIRRTGNRKLGRRFFGVLGHGICALCYFSSIYAGNPWLFVLSIALASFWNDITMGAAWASCIDIGRRYSGIVSGCMNTIGNLGGALAGTATGLILQWYSDPAQIAYWSTLADTVGHAGLLGVMNQTGPPTGNGLDAAWQLKQAATQAGWQVNFISFAAVYVVATLCWLRFDATRPVAPQQNTPDQ